MDALSLVESTGEAAFVCNQDQRIVAWNERAELLLGYKAEQVLGRPCHQVTLGRDIFGNRHCREDCSVIRMARAREPVRPFELDVQTISGERIRLRCCVVILGDPQPSRFTHLHLLAPVSRREDTEFSHQAFDEDRFLTRRENQVLRLLASGSTPREIAESLSLSVTTVRTHIQHLIHKLGVHSTVQAVAAALRNNLV